MFTRKHILCTLSQPLRWLAGMALALLLGALPLQAQEVTFTFANGQITGTSPKFYEFDVMIQASTSGTRLGDTQVYINYNTSAFGTSVATNSKVTVTKAALISGNVLYADPVVNDNTDSRISIQVEYVLPSSPSSAEETPTTATALIHVRLEIADENQTAGLSFQSSLMGGQQFQSDNSTTYPTVTASDTDDASLPVELTAFDALLDGGSVHLTWTTTTETNNAGFEVEHALVSAMPTFSTLGFVNGHGTTLEAQTYTFAANDLGPGHHLFRLKQIDFDGAFAYSDPVAVEVAGRFALQPAYPNPFNPTTRISYDVPQAQAVTLQVYDVLGRTVHVLVDGVQEAGRYVVTFDATSLASGTYYYRLEAGAFSQTRRMLLLK